MFDVKYEKMFETDEGIMYRLTWAVGEEREEKMIFKTWEELERESHS